MFSYMTKIEGVVAQGEREIWLSFTILLACIGVSLLEGSYRGVVD